MTKVMISFFRDWHVFVTMVRRELLKLVSERTRVAGLVLQPLLLWLIFSFGFDSGFSGQGQLAPAGLSFRMYFFPGALLMTILFGCVFSSMTIIDDRAGGFLQAALVTPARTLTVVAGKSAGVMIVTLLQVAILLALGWILLPGDVEIHVIRLAVWSAASCFCLIPINLATALALNSTQSFHAFMGIVLFPLWALSGALFPMKGVGLEVVAMINPLTYMVDGLRSGVCCAAQQQGAPPSVGFAFLFLVALGFIGLIFANWVTRRTSNTL